MNGCGKTLSGRHNELVPVPLVSLRGLVGHLLCYSFPFVRMTFRGLVLLPAVKQERL